MAPGWVKFMRRMLCWVCVQGVGLPPPRPRKPVGQSLCMAIPCKWLPPTPIWSFYINIDDEREVTTIGCHRLETWFINTQVVYLVSV